MENASSAFLDAVRKSMRAIRSAIGSTTITPELLTSAEKLRYESYLRREETNTAIVTLARDGVSIKQIVRRLGHSRNLVRQTLRGRRADVFRTRQRSLDAYYLFLEGQWGSGCRNGAELWRRLQTRGFRGSLRSVGEWTTRRRRSEAVSKQQLQRVPSARTIARLMTIKRDCMTKADGVVITAIETGVPSLVEARTLIDQFHDMIRKKDEAKLDAWIANAKASLVSSFATESSRISQPCAPRSRSLGTAKSKHRSRNSNSSSDKCTGVQNLTFSKHDCSAQRDPQCRHQICVRATLGRLFTPWQYRSASGQTDRRRMTQPAPKLRQEPDRDPRTEGLSSKSTCLSA